MSETLTIRARNLRKNTADAENYLWYQLKSRGLNHYKFRRQYIFDPYIVDFICLRKKLIIELDGGQHAETKKYDEKRTAFLTLCGYEILRFWNDVTLPLPQSYPSELITTKGGRGNKKDFISSDDFNYFKVT